MQHRNTQGYHQASCVPRDFLLWNSRITGGQKIILLTAIPYKIFRKINHLRNNSIEK